MTEFLTQLGKHIPQSAIPIIKTWVERHPFWLKVTNARNTKLGDYRSPTKKLPHRISVNHNLNQYSFLITLTHEYAHLLVFEEFKNRVDPHGKEWKMCYASLLSELVSNSVFPHDLSQAVQNHIKKIPASSSADLELNRELKKYNQATDNFIHLVDLEKGDIFCLKNNRVFVKGEKRRTRFLCLEKKSQKQYLIHGAAEVILVSTY